MIPIYTNDGFMDARSYMLSESIKPSPVDYGTDLYNKEWVKFIDDFDDEYVFTFFTKNDLFYRVDVNLFTNIVSFGVGIHLIKLK